ncbi:MAG: HlyD family secretion protein, partial [Planctomycetota bacterium]|nr:HlyD family secretion protein [Planctomycetota bacterium]
SELKCRALKQQDELAAYQAEIKEKESLEKKRDEKQGQVDQLTVRAPASGKIVTRNPETLLGTYLAEGTEIVSIGSERQKELRVAIAQEDVDVFSQQVGKPVRIRMPGGTVLTCPLSKVTPRASMKASHPSLYAPFGGRLEARKMESGERSDEAYELLKPRFTGVISLTAQQSDQYRAGQRGVVWFGRGREKLGGYFVSLLRDLVPEDFARQYNLAP